MSFPGKDPNLNSVVLNNLSADPVDPAPTGKLRLINRDGSYIVVDENGVETAVGSDSGGSRNYFTNGSFETSTDGVTTGGSFQPTIGLETSTPLIGTQSLKITSAAGTGYAGIEIAGIDNAVITGQILLGLTAYVKTPTLGSTGDWTIGVYNVTDSAYVSDIPQTNLEANKQTVFRGVFVPQSGKTYQLRIQYTVATASRELLVDGLKLTPDSSTAVQAFEQRTVWVDDTILGIVAASSGLTNLPNAITYVRGRSFVDANNKYFFEWQMRHTTASSVTNTRFRFGGVTLLNSATNAGVCDAINEATAGLVISGTEPTTNNIFADAANASNTWRTKGIFECTKPTWFDTYLDSTKVNVLTPSVVSSNSRAQFRRSTTGATKTLGQAMDIFDTSGTHGYVSPDGGIVITTDSRITFRFTGRVEIGGILKLNTATNHRYDIYINGVSIHTHWSLSNGSVLISPCFPVVVTVNTGDYLEIISDTAASVALTSAAFVYVVRLADIGAFSAVGFGRASGLTIGLLPQIPRQRKNLSANVTATGDVTDLTFNNLTSGRTYRWTAHLNYQSNGGGSIEQLLWILRNHATTGTNELSYGGFYFTGGTDPNFEGAFDYEHIFTATQSVLILRVTNYNALKIVGTGSAFNSSWAELHDVTDYYSTVTTWT